MQKSYSRPELLVVVNPQADDILVNSMVSQLIEKGIYFSFDEKQRLPDRLPEDFDTYRAILFDQKIFEDLRKESEVMRRLEAYAAGKGYVFTFNAGTSSKMTRLNIGSSRSDDLSHSDLLHIMLSLAPLQRFHPGLEKVQTERSDEEVISGLKKTLIDNLERRDTWDEFILHFWKAAVLLVDSGEHEYLRPLLQESIRMMAKVPLPLYQGDLVAGLFASVWLHRQTGETEPLDKARAALDVIIEQRPRHMGILTYAGLLDDPLGFRTKGGKGVTVNWRACWRSVSVPEALHMYGGAMSAMTRATGDRRYRDEALKLIRHCGNHHLGDDDLVNHCTRDGEPVAHKWIRAQSHALYGMLYTLEEMEQGDPERLEIIALIRQIGLALRNYQDPRTGLWRNLIRHPQSRLESSGTAAFTYIYGRCIKEGWLAQEEFGEMVRLGRQGLKLCYWRDGFAVCCRGTLPGADEAHYLSRPQGWAVTPQGIMAMHITQGI